MCTYANSGVKRKSLYRKRELQILLISSGHIGAPNNSETVGHEGLRLGQIVYKLVFCNTSFSWLFPLDGFQFIFFVA